MYLLKSTTVYFVLVFGTGFILGTIRVLLLVPRFGNRISELLEMPLMLIAIVLSARWTNRHFADVNGSLKRLWIGLFALGLVLAAELVVGVAIRGMSPVEALVNRDPVSGTVYYIMLGAFALMPWLLAQR
jgi:hypothetical protein